MTSSQYTYCSSTPSPKKKHYQMINALPKQPTWRITFIFTHIFYRKRQRNQRRPGRASHTTPNVLLTRENGHNHMSSPSDHLSSDSPGSDKCLRPERKGNSVQGVYHYDFVVCGFNRMDSRQRFVFSQSILIEYEKPALHFACVRTIIMLKMKPLTKSTI